MKFKKIGKVFTSKSVGTGPSSYKKKRIYRAAVSQRLRNTALGQILYSVSRLLPYNYSPVSHLRICYEFYSSSLHIEKYLYLTIFF